MFPTRKSQFQEEHDLINEELESNPPNLQAHVKNVGVPNAKYWNNTFVVLFFKFYVYIKLS